MDRRTGTRIPLDAPCLLTLVVDHTTAYPAMVTDISRGGLQVALPPDVADGALIVQAHALLRDISEPALALLEGAEGRIAWIAHRHCGLRLEIELPLNDDEIMRTLQF